VTGDGGLRARPSRVGIVGPLLGDHAGWVESPGLALAGRLAAEGTTVRTTSRSVGRLRRTAEVGSIALRWRGRVDVVLVMVFSGSALRLSQLGLRSAAAAGARTVAWVHGGGLPAQADERPELVDGVLALADEVVAPSPWLAGWAEARGHTATVVPNVVDEGLEAHAHVPLRPRLLWMRTYHELYDPRLAVATLAALLPSLPDARLTMAGQDKGLLAVVRDEVAARGLGHAVDVRGYAAGADKAALFAEHDVFLSTNRVDNAPVTLVEAGQAGLPVVALAVGGVPDLLDHGAGGVLVAERSAEALAAAVQGLLADPDRASALVHAGLRRGDQHRWAAVGPRWHEVLRG
jgi:glycosyltransferase involved in cell wall biosynthesis